MRPEQVRKIYDEPYAAGYDSRYLVHEPWSRHVAEYQAEVIGELVGPGDRWLDLGSGTGWYQARFPEVERTGLDLSPAMVAVARRAAPGATFVEGDFRDDHPEWDGRFDLVTCLWFAYCYLDDVDEVAALIARMARWTAPGGACVLQVCDAENVANGLVLPYEDPDVGIHHGQLYITNLEWTYVEPGGTRHERLLAPHLQWTVDQFARWFDEVEVRRWPRYQPSWDRFKGVIARRPLPDAREVGPGVAYAETFPPPDHPLESQEEGTFYEPPPDPAPPPAPGANLGRRSWRRKVWYAAPAPVRQGVRTAFEHLPASARSRLDPRRVRPQEPGSS